MKLRLLKQFVREQDGATMVEYGLMVALIAVISLAVIGALGDGIFDAFDQTNDQIQSPATPVDPTTPSD